MSTAASERVQHRCYNRVIPTARPRHTITETPPVREALDELRSELGGDRIELPELVILGAREKASQLRAQRADAAALRRALAEEIRAGTLPVDPQAGAEVRRSGWARA